MHRMSVTKRHFSLTLMTKDSQTKDALPRYAKRSHLCDKKSHRVCVCVIQSPSLPLSLKNCSRGLTPTGATCLLEGERRREGMAFCPVWVSGLGDIKPAPTQPLPLSSEEAQ